MTKTTLFAVLALFFTPELLAQQRSYNEVTRKRGITSYDGTPIIPAEYDDVEAYFFDTDTFYIATLGVRKGIFNQKGELTVPFEYQEVALWAAQSIYQFGFAMVTKDRNTGRGIVDAQTGQRILPPKFEFVRALFPDLLVGREFADSTLQFFNARGEPLFQRYGRSVSTGFDEHSIQIERVDRSTYFADKNGAPIFPSHLSNPRWTDGKRVICSKNGQMGIVNMSGKILVPYVWTEIKPQNPGQFLVKNNREEKGLIDAKGRFIIPLSSGGLYLPGGKPGPLYIRSDVGSDPNYNFQIMDSAGRLLFSEVRILTVWMSNEVAHHGKNQSRAYYMAETKDKKERYLFHHSRGQILPDAWASIQYGGEKHPLIVHQKSMEDLPIHYKAMNLNGDVLFAAPDLITLTHTPHPQLLIAHHILKDRSALIHLDQLPKTIAFDCDRIYPLTNGYFCYEQNKQRGLLDPNGKVLVPAEQYIQINAPNEAAIMAFRADNRTRGKLVAIGRYKGLAYHDAWVGLNEQGESFLFEPKVLVDSPKNDPKPVVETVAGDPYPPEILEAPPVAAINPSDEIFSMVEIKPEFPGGEEAMLQFLAQNLKYPAIAAENGVQGRVVVSFIVEKNGTLSNITIVRDIGGGCGTEASRLIRSMPKWVSGQQHGKPVRVKYILPVNFRLN